MHRQPILSMLARHTTAFMEEAGYLRRAINYIENQPACFYRETCPAHVTASAWVVNPNQLQVLLLHHRKLGQWFQPGGHADGDEDMLAVAVKEVLEETGLSSDEVNILGSELFDIDIHRIPPLGKDPAHEHIDFRFLMQIDDSVKVPGNHESNDIRWVPLYQVTRYNNNRSTYRMVEKTRRLRSFQAFQQAG